jgi:molybdate transport system substrate-binding protein
MKPRLVMGENIAQTAQFVEAGAADAGIVALSLVKSPALANRGAYTLIPADWHDPLEQGYVITSHGKDNPLAAAFAKHMESPATRAIMRRYGFVLPGEEGRN